MVSRMLSVNPQNKNIHYAYIHLKLFSIVGVEKCFHIFTVPEIEAICNRCTKKRDFFVIETKLFHVHFWIVLYVTEATNNNGDHFKFVVRIHYLQVTNEWSVTVFVICNLLCTVRV